MGKPDTVMQSYLSDRERFADLFNGVFFQGEQVIRACDLQNSSERYSEPQGHGANRYRDIKMSIKDGGSLRVLAVENQANIDYTMPCRCMRYDVMEYEKQLKELRNRNERQNLLKTPSELLCGISKTDRLIPVYTLCLYHGEEPWDGPLSLQEMMDFDGKNDRYRHLSSDTAEALSVFLNIPDIRQKYGKYRNAHHEEEYNMCQAWEELKAEYIAEGTAEGLLEKTRHVVKNMLKHGFSDSEICELAECTVELINSLR